jgi:hypothetical protein
VDHITAFYDSLLILYEILKILKMASNWFTIAAKLFFKTLSTNLFIVATVLQQSKAYCLLEFCNKFRANHGLGFMEK